MLDHLIVKTLAAEAGFDLCGITPCGHLHDNEAWLRAWLEAGHHATMAYMARNVEKRADARLLFEGARTAVVCAVNYKNRVGAGYPAAHRAKVASYACAADYHATIKGMLGHLFEALRATCPDLRGRAFVDSAPLFEKQLAVDAGLGWIGRQSLLITPRYGSYVLLGELLLDAPVDRYDQPFQGSLCGRCNNCVESCPNGAIVAPRVIDARRCISCLTIEKEAGSVVETCQSEAIVPDGISGAVNVRGNTPDLDGWIFGCDRCQSCCPHNRHAPEHTNVAFDMCFDPLEMDAAAWLTMDDRQFETRMSRTPLTRSGLARIKRNILRGESK